MLCRPRRLRTALGTTTNPADRLVEGSARGCHSQPRREFDPAWTSAGNALECLAKEAAMNDKDLFRKLSVALTGVGDLDAKIAEEYEARIREAFPKESTELMD